MDSKMNITTRKIYSNDELAEQLNDEFRAAVMPVTVFVGIEAVVGFIGNLLVIYAFLFHYHVCNFRYFVLCMAFVDFTSTLTTMPGEVVTQLYWFIYPYKILCKVKSFFNMFTVTAEAFCLLTIALDRYRKVCAPFGWQIQPNIAIILCGVIYTLAFIIALPVGIYWGIHHSQHRYKNQTVTVTICEKDEEFKGTEAPLHYSLAVEGITSICLILMFMLYIFVAKKLICGKYNIGGKPTIKVIKAPPYVPEDSSGVKDKNESDMSSRQENSDTGYSSGVDSKSQKARYNNISSDGGLTTDEEEESTSRSTTLAVPSGSSGGYKEKASRKPTRSQSVRRSGEVGMRVRRKTKIMIILTVIFIVTTIMYLTLLSFITENVLPELSAVEKAVYFFFFRLVFINHMINPMLYGFLDPHFKKAMLHLKHKVWGGN